MLFIMETYNKHNQMNIIKIVIHMYIHITTNYIFTIILNIYSLIIII